MSVGAGAALLVLTGGAFSTQTAVANIDFYNVSDDELVVNYFKKVRGTLGTDSQDLINAVLSVDEKLVSNVKIFDVYEGDNIPENQKSIAINVTIQSSDKTLNDNDLEKISKSIIQTVEYKTGAKIRS